MEKLYQNSKENPFHISVGAVAVSKDGKILVHRRTKENVPAIFTDTLGGLSEAYVLMHESLEDGEPLDAAVIRGLKEEFGAVGTVRKYLGSRNFVHSWADRSFEKTVLYFLADIEDMGARPEDTESWTDIVWVEPDFLLERMREQETASSRPDFAEAKIVEAYLKYGNS